MNYALGCAFNIDDLMYNFPKKKLKTKSGASLTAKIKDPFIATLIKRVFLYSIELVIHDIIENNTTFWLPLNGSKKCNLHMMKFQGHNFKSWYKHGKWKGLDFMKSYFCGFLIGMFLYGNRTPRTKFVYVNPAYRDRIVEKANQGFNYGDSKYDVTIKDYYNKIFEKFNQFPQEDIKIILTFMWKSLYLHVSYGGDVRVFNRNIWMYVGFLKKSPLRHFEYYIKKICLRLRVLFRRKLIPWDGYYYFALTKKLYENWLSLQKLRGRKRKYFKFSPNFLYLLKDECILAQYGKRYIFRVKYPAYIRFRIFRYEFITDKAEFYKVISPRKFKDILVSNYKYICIDA